MKRFHSSVTDLRRRFSGEFDTFPYECGWADEAIYFVTVDEGTAPDTLVVLRVQVSADGIRWLDEGTAMSITGPGSAFARVSHFGGYLRLAGTATAPPVAASAQPETAAATSTMHDLAADEVLLTVRLALKG